jgi:hypothetical protein
VATTSSSEYNRVLAFNDGRKSSRKKTQTREEGRRVFSESFEEHPREEDPLSARPFCIRLISPVAMATFAARQWVSAA